MLSAPVRVDVVFLGVLVGVELHNPPFSSVVSHIGLSSAGFRVPRKPGSVQRGFSGGGGWELACGRTRLAVGRDSESAMRRAGEGEGALIHGLESPRVLRRELRLLGETGGSQGRRDGFRRGNDAFQVENVKFGGWQDAKSCIPRGK